MNAPNTAGKAGACWPGMPAWGTGACPSPGSSCHSSHPRQGTSAAQVCIGEPIMMISVCCFGPLVVFTPFKQEIKFWPRGLQ